MLLTVAPVPVRCYLFVDPRSYGKTQAPNGVKVTLYPACGGRHFSVSGSATLLVLELALMACGTSPTVEAPSWQIGTGGISVNGASAKLGLQQVIMEFFKANGAVNVQSANSVVIR